MGRIASNYIYNVIYKLITLLTPILTAPYLSRVLGADSLGIYSYVSSSGSIVSTLAMLGIYAYGTRQIAYTRDEPKELNKTFWEIMTLRCVLTVIGTAFYFTYMRLNDKYDLFFLVYFPYVLAEFIDCSWVYVGLEEMKPTVAKNLVAKLFSVVGIFLFVKKKEDLILYFVIVSATSIIASFSIYFKLNKYITLKKPSWGFRRLFKHLSGSFVLFLPQAASLLYLQVDKVMIEWLTNQTAQLSYYDQAEKIVSIPLSIITVLSSVMMPRIANEFYKDNMEKIKELLLYAGRFSLLIAFPLMVGIICIAYQFIPWYLGNEFVATAHALIILAPIVVFNTLSGISGTQYFTATNQVSVLTRTYVVAAITNLVVNALMIPKFGYAGAAIATVISSFVLVVYQYAYLIRQINLKSLVSICLKYGIVSLIMGIVVWGITQNYTCSPITTVLQGLIGIIVYFGILLIVKDKTVMDGFYMLKNYMRRKI